MTAAYKRQDRGETLLDSSRAGSREVQWFPGNKCLGIVGMLSAEKCAVRT